MTLQTKVVCPSCIRIIPITGFDGDEKVVGKLLICSYCGQKFIIYKKEKQMEKEFCFNHPETEAIKWRDTMIFGEPNRVLLCAECCDLMNKYGISTYPLTEITSLYTEIEINSVEVSCVTRTKIF